MFEFRKTSLAVLTTAVMMCGTSAFAAETSTGPFGSGTIHFTGTVTNAPCSIAPGDDNLAISLGQVSSKQLATAGATSPSVPVVIHLTGCSFEPAPEGSTAMPMSKVTASFSGPFDDTNNGYMNTASSGATGVVVQLLNGDNSTPVSDQKSIPQTLNGGENELQFYARMLATDAATPGPVLANVTYTLTYE
ncbi:fimbrial protein StdA [Salmonella enterica subsp. enterica serovar Poona]|nr:fimbrial protein StdA [Salmonella enterica subsp. enterica serovar Poona]